MKREYKERSAAAQMWEKISINSHYGAFASDSVLLDDDQIKQLLEREEAHKELDKTLNELELGELC